MTTKQKILNEALTLFAEKGYSAVYVGEIADAVGIKTPSLYKHYKNKQNTSCDIYYHVLIPNLSRCPFRCHSLLLYMFYKILALLR